jgi:TRAP-type C4-dicarboxylate transport system permease small subunit
MRKCLDGLYLLGCWLAACCLCLICLLVVSQVALNLLDRLSMLFTGSAIGLTIPSYADFTGFLLAAASFLSLAYTLRQGGHIRVILLIDNLPKNIRRFAEIWSVGFCLALTLYFTWYTASLTHESYVYHDLSSGMIAVPLWIPQAAMLFGLVLLCLALLDELATILVHRTPSYLRNSQGLLVEERMEEKEGNACMK